MSGTKPQRQELSKFLAETSDWPEIYANLWRVLHIHAIPQIGSVFDVLMFKSGVRPGLWRIYAFNIADFAIRPPNPATIEGGPAIKFSTDDPRLNDRLLQCIPGGDGEVYDPPRRFQLLELDQTWVIAERFEIEPLPER
ncbi:MAG: hypothetical protein U1F83_14050 [Verrucomicrobiota bacterium]